MRTVRLLAPLVGALGALSACGSELGECDREAANELVYSSTWKVATKGQALMHDSCGNASFCHSAGARGPERVGAPFGMDFDMLPLAKGWPEVVDQREEIWRTVDQESMPPDGVGKEKQGNGDWSFDHWRRKDSERLPGLHTSTGKAAMRNWLACGAPVLKETEVPLWARPTADTDLADWSGIHQTLIKGRCATGGCHNAGTRAGGLDLTDECLGYQALFENSESCGGAPRLTAPDLNSSFFQQLARQSTCGDPMPPDDPLTEPELQVIREWIVGGALAKNCGGT
jgi:hypothetical protein